MFRSFDGTLLTTRSPILIWPDVISSSPARQRRAVVLPQPDGPTRTRNSPSLISRSRSFTAIVSSAYAFVTWSKVTVAIAVMLTRERFRAKALEVRDELLALGEQPPFAEHAGAHPALDALDEGAVLQADLVVERDQLVHPRLVDVRREEVVEKAPGSLGPEGQHRTAGEIRMAGEDVQAEVRPEEVKLAPRHLPVGQEGSAVRPERADLAGHEAMRLEQVGVRRHVDHCAEPGMGDGAVVALEEVLAGDLPIHFQLEFGAKTELERVDVQDLCQARGDVAQCLGQRVGVWFRIDEDERAPGVDSDMHEPELLGVEARLPIRAGGRPQPPVEAVGPRVVGALQRLACARSVCHHVSAVTADV